MHCMEWDRHRDRDKGTRVVPLNPRSSRRQHGALNPLDCHDFATSSTISSRRSPSRKMCLSPCPCPPCHSVVEVDQISSQVVGPVVSPNGC